MTGLVKPIAVAAAFVLAVFAIGRAWDYELATAAPPDTGGIGTAATVNADGHQREYGYGMVSFNRRGPEAWRWQLVKERRRSQRLQRRLTARVLQVRSLRRVVGQSFIPAHWVAVLSCESGVDWTYHGSSGFHGAPQFHPGTWSAYRLPSYPAYAYQASPFQQLVVAELVLARQGWRAWPACSRKVGLR